MYRETRPPTLDYSRPERNEHVRDAVRGAREAAFGFILWAAVTGLVVIPLFWLIRFLSGDL